MGGNYNIIDIAASSINRKIADRYGQEIIDVMCDRTTLNSFIHVLLTERLERLKLRSSAKEAMFKTQAEFRKYPEKFENVRYERVAHTHPSMILKHYANDSVMRRQARGDTTFYQFVNSLIVGLYKIAEPRELSEKTRLLIRASACLHGLLKGETDDLGHPDEAIYQDDSDPRGKLFDLDLYETHIFKSELVDMPLLGYSKGKTIRIYMTQYERSQEDRSYYYKGIPPLPYPEWIAPKLVAVSDPQCSTPFAGAAPASDKRTTTSKNMRIKADKSTILAPIDANSSREQKRLLSCAPHEAVKVRGDYEIKAEIVSIPTSSAVTSDCASHEVVKVPGDYENRTIDQAIQVDGLDQVIEDMDHLKICEDSDIPPAKLQTAVSEKEKTYATASSYDTASSSGDQDRLAPRGMRLFHSRQNHQFTTLRTRFEDLASRHATTLISIHHHQQFKNVSYKLVAALWRHTCGPDSIRESTGSSHIVLLDAKGLEVGGTFAHGHSMTYSNKTIVYIREYFRMIGFGVESIN